MQPVIPAAFAAGRRQPSAKPRRDGTTFYILFTAVTSPIHLPLRTLAVTPKPFAEHCSYRGRDRSLARSHSTTRIDGGREMKIRRRNVVSGLAAGLACGAQVSNAAGPSATAVKIGNTMPYSGPLSNYGVIGQAESAFFRMINDQGGVDGHKIDFISLDDGSNPSRTVEDVRRLLEEMRVDLFFNTLGCAQNSAIVNYLSRNQVPQLFIGCGASKWSDYKEYPWAMGWQPSYRTEAQIYAKYMLRVTKDPKVAILYQNDDFGKGLSGWRARCLR
jgi:ABC-type branched-subunit amino acid transport system substrate-binding protein